VNYNVKRAIIFAYDDSLIVIPDFEVSKTKKIMVYYSPESTEHFAKSAESFARGYRGYGSYSPFFYGPVIGAESSLGEVIDEQNIEFVFKVPVVRIERYGYSQTQYILRLPGVDICLLYINNGSVLGILENCSITENSGAIIKMTPSGLEVFEHRMY